MLHQRFKVVEALVEFEAVVEDDGGEGVLGLEVVFHLLVAVLDLILVKLVFGVLPFQQGDFCFELCVLFFEPGDDDAGVDGFVAEDAVFD